MATRVLAVALTLLALHTSAAAAASVSAAADPATIRLTGTPTTITVSAEVASSVANHLSAYVVEGDCPASGSGEIPDKSWQLLLSDPFPSKPQTDTFRFSADRAGQFEVCAYLDPGDGPPQTASAPLTVTPAGGSIALAPSLDVVVMRTSREQIPTLSVTAGGSADAAGELVVYAIRDGESCALPASGLPDDNAKLVMLEPQGGAGAASAKVGPGPFSERFRGQGLALNARKGPSLVNPITLLPDHWNGTVRYRVCATVTHGEQPLLNERIDGPSEIPQFALAQTFTFATVVIRPLPRRVLRIERWHWGQPSVTIMFRGCNDDVHLFRGIALRGQKFHARLHFADGRVGKVRGRFNGRFRKVTGRVVVPRCGIIKFTRRGRF